MELLLIRRKDQPAHLTCTFGSLFVNDQHECYTLEDVVREVPGKPVSEWKIKKETAIPRGRYQILMYDSPKFKALLPHLQDVPGFSHILIHGGNTDADTDGCILVGYIVKEESETLLQSQAALQPLIAKIKHALANKEEVWITIA